MTVQTMSRNRRKSSSSKGRSQELDWDAIEDPDCVAKPGWQDEPKTPWTCTTCKAYVKMKHLAKLWPEVKQRYLFHGRKGQPKIAGMTISGSSTLRFMR
jgi:hypothetical protein